MRKLHLDTRILSSKRSRWTLSSITIALYISHLSQEGLAPSTVASHLSVLSYVHKLQGFKDPGASFLVSKVLVGIKKMNDSVVVRSPILHDMLCKLMDSSTHVTDNVYESTLVEAMYSTMFYAFLHIGEVTKSQHNILLSHVHGSQSKMVIKFLIFTYHSGLMVNVNV